MLAPDALVASLGWRYLESLGAVADVYDPLRLRAWWLGELRRMTAEYMRSPSFLELMRFNLTLMTRPRPPISLLFPKD
ncbi:MAG TPA: hypothetical protein VHK47_17850 [Polyangia bacterium]|jgi:hypothetical protein|nr:hypothetical protein [Polyangia bacterium]